MPKTLLLALAALLVLPSVASAATATADIEKRHGTRFGPVTFKAARGEANDVVVTQGNGRLRFLDRANRVRAKGDCKQVDRHTATCPVTEYVAKIKLDDRADVATVSGLVEVRGGSGADRLRGSPGFDDLNGQTGNDTLIGRDGGDELTGGRGRDRLFGAAGDDDLIDGEHDAEPDLFVGGSSRDTAGRDRGDFVIYAGRTDDLRANVLTGEGPDNDELVGIESLEGGFGNDRLTGDHDDNHLVGKGGHDVLRAGAGDDVVDGVRGNDVLIGAEGNDLLDGEGGVDTFKAGSGDDTLVVDFPDDDSSETAECGTGNDLVQSISIDTLEECEIANAGSLYVQVQPEISGNTATFQVACQRLNGCDGAIRLSGPEDEDFGTGTFADLPDDPETFSPVTVTLTDEAVQALAQGVVVEVVYSGEFGGYSAFLQSG